MNQRKEEVSNSLEKKANILLKVIGKLEVNCYGE